MKRRKSAKNSTANEQRWKNSSYKKKVNSQYSIKSKFILNSTAYTPDELRRRIDDNTRLVRDLHQLQSELDEVKSQLCVANIQLESNVEDTKRKADEEIASLQQLVHGINWQGSCRNFPFINKSFRYRNRWGIELFTDYI